MAIKSEASNCNSLMSDTGGKTSLEAAKRLQWVWNVCREAKCLEDGGETSRALEPITCFLYGMPVCHSVSHRELSIEKSLKNFGGVYADYTIDRGAD